MARQLSDLIAPGEPKQIASGLQFTEGPLWHPGGYLLFSDIPADTIYRWEPGREARRYIKPSRQSNGLTFDPLERLIACEHRGRQVSRIVPGGAMGTLVDNYQGKRLNSPNDVVVRSDGLILFTDPPYGLNSAYNGVQRAAEIGFNGVFAFDEASGRMVLIDDALERPNGIALSPDESTLYVSDSASNKLWAYSLAADGSATDKRLLADLAIEGKPFPVDGLRVDSEGRVFATCPAGVCVIAPDGTRVATLELPIRASNVGWAGPDLSELYITSGTEVWKVSTRARGIGSSLKLAPAR